MDVRLEVFGLIYKNRIKIKNFFVDFDRHQRGIITEAQFKSAIHGLAGIPLLPTQLDELAAHYAEPDGRTNYRQFCADCDLVFTTNFLETKPLEFVPEKPVELLNTTRFVSIPHTFVATDTEEGVQAVLEELKTRVAKRRILVKPIFEDHGKGAPHSVLHMTPSRFRRGVKMFAPDLSIAKVDMLIEKFLDHDRLVNFAAFLAIIDPPPVYN